MKTDKKPPTSSWTKRIMAWSVALVGHVLAVTLVTMIFVTILGPASTIFGAIRFSMKVDQLQGPALQSALQLLALGSAIWGIIFLTFKMFTRRRESAKVMTLKRNRGTVMVETVIILPLYFLFMFGMSQLGLNLIHGTMANVGGYMASRAYWVWEGEVGQNRTGTTVSSDQAKDKARIAGSLVMAAVAPGSFVGIGGGSLTSDAKAARKMTAPLGFDTNGLNNILNALDGGLGVGNTSFYRTFGKTPFLIRGATKFTHAYKVSKVTPLAGGGGVKFEYNVAQTMPVVGQIFGKYKLGGAQTAGLKGFHWSLVTREYNFSKQKYTARPDMPNSFFSATPPAERDPEGDILNESGTF